MQKESLAALSDRCVPVSGSLSVGAASPLLLLAHIEAQLSAFAVGNALPPALSLLSLLTHAAPAFGPRAPPFGPARLGVVSPAAPPQPGYQEGRGGPRMAAARPALQRPPVDWSSYHAPSRLFAPAAEAQPRPGDGASSFLARFGLSSQDLETLSLFPEEQLTPEALPLILRTMGVLRSKQGLPARPRPAPAPPPPLAPPPPQTLARHPHP
ncbi:hypothetical protein AAFF_G00293350 [Aldrovandia affinis]|uniref:Uncharacterized protein n=1 Tax=Aldrovandia affinis TaxID=143900 RepID=A0AAD7R947_9TELE|nr:hypothetical protein AAFF_G00293350 [Aldrovandia affinis]